MENIWVFILGLGLILILKFKSVFLKLILSVFWYPLVTMYLFCIDYELGGSLDVIGRPLHESICKEAFIYALIAYYLLVAVLWKIRNVKYSFKRTETHEFSRIIFVFFFLIISAIAFPRAFGLANQRWNLIPGPWVVVFISMNVVLFTSYESLKQKSSILHLLILGICFAGGERANSALVLLLFFLFISNDGSVIKERKIKYYYLLFFFGIAVLGIAAQSWRSGGDFTYLALIQNLISLRTVGDVVHIYFSSFSYIEKYPLTLNPLINELASMFNVPNYGGTGKHVSYNFTEILREYIYNYGGGLFYTEGVLVFGKIGVLIYSLIYGLLIRFLYVKNNVFKTSIMLVFILSQMRLQWYGLMYIYTPIWLSYIFIWLLGVLNRIRKY